MGGHTLQHCRGSPIKVYPSGNMDQPLGGYSSIFRITAKNTSVSNAISGLHAFSLTPQRGHNACCFHAYDKRKLRRITALAVVNVDEIHPGSFDLDNRL